MRPGLLFLALTAVACTGVAGADGLSGPRGDAGPQGVQGIQGPQGVPGPAGAPAAAGGAGFGVRATTLCQYSLTPSGVSLLLSYTDVEYTNGDVLVACTVFNGTVSSSETVYYDHGQVGSGTHGCQAGALANNPGYWYFELVKSGYVATFKPDNTPMVEFTGPSSTEMGCTTLTR